VAVVVAVAVAVVVVVDVRVSMRQPTRQIQRQTKRQKIRKTTRQTKRRGVTNGAVNGTVNGVTHGAVNGAVIGAVKDEVNGAVNTAPSLHCRLLIAHSSCSVHAAPRQDIQRHSTAHCIALHCSLLTAHLSLPTALCSLHTTLHCLFIACCSLLTRPALCMLHDASCCTTSRHAKTLFTALSPELHCIAPCPLLTCHCSLVVDALAHVRAALCSLHTPLHCSSHRRGVIIALNGASFICSPIRPLARSMHLLHYPLDCSLHCPLTPHCTSHCSLYTGHCSLPTALYCTALHLRCTLRLRTHSYTSHTLHILICLHVLPRLSHMSPSFRYAFHTLDHCLCCPTLTRSHTQQRIRPSAACLVMCSAGLDEHDRRWTMRKIVILAVTSSSSWFSCDARRAHPRELAVRKRGCYEQRNLCFGICSLLLTKTKRSILLCLFIKRRAK
jgi:hypothetical protein